MGVLNSDMNTDDLKTGIFGYDKASVYRYITNMEAEFSALISEKEEEHRRVTEYYLIKISELEEELSMLRNQCCELKDSCTAISEHKSEPMLANTSCEQDKPASLDQVAGCEKPNALETKPQNNADTRNMSLFERRVNADS